MPKISCSPCPSRSLVPEPQSAEQLVEVPTVLSPLRIAEQIVGIPVPRGRGERRVQGFLPRQSSTATPFAEERISERIVEQLVDISPGGGLGQGSASSAGAAGGDFTGFFRTFRQIAKSAKLASHSSPRVPASVSPSTPAAQLEDAPLPDSIEWVQLRERHAGKTFHWNRRTRATVWKAAAGGSARGLGRESTTGTGMRVSPRLTSLLFLLGEERYRQPRAVFKYWAPRRLCCVEIFSP